MKTTRTVLLALVAGITLAVSPALSQNYPERPVKIIVPTTAGGGYDLVGRLLAEQLSRNIGGRYIIENMAGAGSLIGTRAAAKLPPDGYGLMIGGLANIVLTMALYSNPGYQPDKDFVPIGLVSTVPYVLVARKDLPYKTLADIVSAGRDNPGTLNVATAGPGTGQDIMASMFSGLLNVRITNVPYRGSAGIYPDLMTGRVDLFFDVVSSALPHAESGAVRIIATLGTNRNPRIPDVPTAAEAGFSELSTALGSWVGLFAPAGTPEPIIQILRRAVSKSVTDPEFRQKIEGTGSDMIDIPLEQTQALIEQETARWLPLMRKAGIQPE